MFYGSAKARVFLWSIVIMGLAAVLFGVLAAVLGSFAFGTGAFVCALSAFVTSQSASLTEIERSDRRRREKLSAKGAEGLDTSGEMQEGQEDR